jgi:hypothetical protein
MKLAYLPTSEAGIRWMRTDDRRNPQRDVRRVADALRMAETVLRENPLAGRRFEDFDNVREHLLQGTSFSLLYTVARNPVSDHRFARPARPTQRGCLEPVFRELRARLGEGAG